MINLFNKYREVIAYLFFGGCTTLINIISFWICVRLFSISATISTIIAWFLSVLAAYLTNRTWVFNSKASGIKEITSEITKFFSCRILTGLLDLVIIYVFVERLGFYDMLIKIISNVIVVIANFVASKLIIFKSGDK